MGWLISVKVRDDVSSAGSISLAHDEVKNCGYQNQCNEIPVSSHIDIQTELNSRSSLIQSLFTWLTFKSLFSIYLTEK